MELTPPPRQILPFQGSLGYTQSEAPIRPLTALPYRMWLRQSPGFLLRNRSISGRDSSTSNFDLPSSITANAPMTSTR